MADLLKTVEEIKDVEVKAGVVVNGVDNPNIMSVDSTEPIAVVTDSLDVLDDDGKEELELKTEKTEKKEEKEEKKEKKEEKKEEKQEKEKPEKDEKKEEDPEKIAAKEKEKKEKADDELAEPEYSKKVQRRVGKLTKRMRTAEREAEYEKEKRLELQKKLDIANSKVLATDKPLKKDFDDEDAFIEALTDWKIDQRFVKSQEAKEEKIKDKEEKDSVMETYTGYDDVMDDGIEKYDDFEKLVLHEDLILTPVVTQISLGTKNPEDVLYYLASNPDESERISRLDPVRSGMEIAKLEVKLLAEMEKSKEKKEEKEPVKKQSKAPAPIKPVRTDGALEKDPNKMNAKEYRAWRESQKT